MKRIFIYTVIIGFTLMLLCSCDPKYAFMGCSYEYPLDIKNLNDTIKTTDTLWVENDFDSRFCLEEGVYRNGTAEETPNFYKLIADSMVYYTPEIIGYDREWEAIGRVYLSIYIKEKDGKYKSKYGIVFTEPGIYSLSGFGGNLANGKDHYLSLYPYFNTSSNNTYLLPNNLQQKYPNKPPYREYYIMVVG